MTPRAVRTLVAAVCAAAALAGCSTADTAAPSSSGDYADIAKSPACAKLRQDHPDLGGKTMCNAVDEDGRQTHILGVVGLQTRVCYTRKKSVPCP